MNSTACSAVGAILVGAMAWVPAVLLLSRANAILCETSPPEVHEPDSKRTITLTVLFDNYPHGEGLRTGWGFSCLVKGLENTILFDTGGDGRILLSNMERLGLDPAEVEIVVLSHVHADHTGGLERLLARNANVKVFVPVSFPERFKEGVRARGASVISVDEPCKVCEGAQTTGELGDGIKEQALGVSTSEGLFVITGCAHPGVVKMVEAARRSDSCGVHGVIGGFHMKGFSEAAIRGVIDDLKRLGIKIAGPCHCSGDLTRKMFSKAFGESYLDVGVGTVIELESPKESKEAARVQ